MKLQKVAYNMDYTVDLYLDIYFMLDTAKVASSSLALSKTVTDTDVDHCNRECLFN